MRAVFQFSILVLVAILIFIISHPQKYLSQFFQAKKMLAAAAVILLAPSIVTATDCRLFTVGECTPSNDIWVDEVTLLSIFFPPHFHFLFLQIWVDEVNVLSLFFPFHFSNFFFQMWLNKATMLSLVLSFNFDSMEWVALLFRTLLHKY